MITAEKESIDAPEQRRSVGHRLKPQRPKQPLYSITSSARASMLAGTSRPSALAAFRLIVTAARQIENRMRDLYLHEALRKYAADRREEPSRHVVAALRRLLAPCGF
jgi:hypothetical protein